MAKKKKNKIIGWVDENGNTSDTQPITQTTKSGTNIIGYVDENGKTSSSMPYENKIRSVQSTVDGLNNFNKKYKTENTITDSSGNVTVTSPIEEERPLTKKEKKEIYKIYKDISDKQDKLVNKQVQKNSEKTIKEYSKMDEERRERWKNPSLTIDEALNQNINPYSKEYKKEELDNAVSEEDKKKLEDLRNTQKYTTYLKNAAYEQTKDTTNLEKILGPLSQAGGLVTGLSKLMGDTKYIDENGKEIYLPNKLDLYNQRISESYKTPIGKFYGDVVGGSSKILASQGVNALAPGVGTGLYWTSMFGETYTDAKNKGVDDGNAVVNAGIKTALEYVTSKFLGSATKKLTGGTTSELEKAISNTTYNTKIMQKLPDGARGYFANIIGSAGSEGTEEALQNYLENITDILTLGSDGKHNNIGEMLKDPDVFGDAIYAGLVGGATGGALSTLNGDVDTTNNKINQLNLFKSALQEDINNTTDKSKQEKLQEIVNNIDKTLQKPFSIEENTLQDYENDLINQNLNIQQPLQQIQPELSTQTPLNTLSSNIQEQNIQTPFQEQTPQITPLNQVNQELKETRQQDVADSVRAMNLETPQEFTQKQGNYVYEKHENPKIDTLRQDIARHFTDSEETRNFAKTLEKIIEDKNVEIRFNPNLRDSQGRIANGSYSNGVITLNPNSNRAGEFLAIHELTHAIGTKPMIKMVENYRKSNAEFNNAVEKLLGTYNATEINEEALGDIAGQLFGNQEYINNLSMENPSLFKKIYNEIKYLWHQFRGYKNQDQFIEDLRNKWESAYRNQEVQQKAKNSNIEMSNQTDSNGNMLSNEQVDYFKDSKVRDENGNLIIMNHATNDNSFTIFDENKQGTNSSNFKQKGELGRGFYFSDEQTAYTTWNDYVERQTGKPVKGMSVYLKINNPFYYSTSELNKDVKNYLKDKDAIMSRIKSNADIIKFANFTDLDIQNMLKELGYDGIIERDDNNIYQAVVFNSDQIKNVDNLTPTQDNDIRYSKEEITKDNTGKELSKQQQEYFKNSKVRDKDGKLMEIYHGASTDFNIYDTKFLGKNGLNYGIGFYLTNDIEEANKYAKNGVLKKQYVNIEKPLNLKKKTITENEIKNIVTELNNKYKYYKTSEELTNAINQINNLENNDYILSTIKDRFTYPSYELDDLSDRYATIMDTLKNNTKYDGIIIKSPYEKGKNIYIAFEPNQIKNVDNLNPTEDPDIRYSKDNQTWREYLEKEFPSQGTRTNLQDINERNKPKQENKTIQEEKPQEMPKNEVKQEVKKSYLTSAEQNELDGLKSVENSGFAELTKKEQARMEELEKKSQGITKKFPELKKTVTQEDTKPLYFKYKDNEISKENNKILNEAKKIVESNNQGRRTKEQWLQVAEYIGSNADIKNSTDLQKLAMETWLASRPNTKDNLNRQGKKYVDFKTNEWFNAMYKGAGVGTDIKMSLEEATDTKGNKVDLKPTGNNVYERVNVKPTKNQVIPDMSNKVLNIGNEKVSNFYSNITEKSKFITEENREALKDNANLQYYDAITNKDTLESAMDKLNKNPEQQTGDFFAKKEFTPEDVATGWILVKRYQDAGNYEAMSNVIEKMREQGTKAGQTVQMYGILQRLTPEGMEYYSQKQLDNAFKKFSEGKSKQKIEQYAPDFTLTAEEHQFIKDTMEKVQNMTDEEQKKVEIAKIVSMLNEKIPPEKGQRLKAWMRIAMLGNPKTQVRNVAGNAIIQPVNWVGDVFSATADKIISKKTGKRTIGTTDFGALVQGTKKGFKDAVRDAKTGVDTRDINLDRFEENIGANPFYEKHEGTKRILNPAAKALNKTNRILGNIMSGGDRIFYQAVYDNSLKNQMKLNKVDTPTQEMMDIAEQEALSRTWNDSNSYTKSVLQIRNAMNKLNVKGYGLGDVLVPFAKTPANLTKAIVDYSPVGLTRTILSDGKKLRNSLENGQYNAQLQHQFADSFGKGVAGSMLWVAAYALAKAGITSGKSDDDKDVSNFMRNTLGIQPYSIKIGDKSFTYDWAQPIAAPFAAMSDYQSLTDKEKKDLGSTIEKMTSSASNILLEQSFLSSIQDVFNSYEGPTAAIKQQIQDLPARATPTFFKQIADLIDSTSRQTFVKGDTKETMKNKVQVKIPGKSKELVEQRDTLGREIKKYGGDEDKLKYAFNVFLNPANTNKGKTSKAAEEIYEVYKATGDKTIMPRQVGYSEMINGESRNLTAKERSEWQKLSGEKIEENVKALTQNSTYKQMSDEDKAAVINGIVNYSFAKAKSDLFDTNISTMYKTAAKKEEQGIPLYDYYIERISKRR